MKRLIYNRRKGSDLAPLDAIYCGRGTPYGNIFVMTHETGGEESIGSRTWACTQFEKYAAERVTREPSWLAPLRGKSLVCWCSPKRCHCETLIRLANDEAAKAGAAI
jgi:hypothetical protein